MLIGLTLQTQQLAQTTVSGVGNGFIRSAENVSIFGFSAGKYPILPYGNVILHCKITGMHKCIPYGGIRQTVIYHPRNDTGHGS